MGGKARSATVSGVVDSQRRGKERDWPSGKASLPWARRPRQAMCSSGC